MPPRNRRRPNPTGVVPPIRVVPSMGDMPIRTVSDSNYSNALTYDIIRGASGRIMSMEPIRPTLMRANPAPNIEPQRVKDILRAGLIGVLEQHRRLTSDVIALAQMSHSYGGHTCPSSELESVVRHGNCTIKSKIINEDGMQFWGRITLSNDDVARFRYRAPNTMISIEEGYDVVLFCVLPKIYEMCIKWLEDKIAVTPDDAVVPEPITADARLRRANDQLARTAMRGTMAVRMRRPEPDEPAEDEEEHHDEPIEPEPIGEEEYHYDSGHYEPDYDPTDSIR